MTSTHACAVSRILASTMDEISSAEKRFFSPLYSTAQGTATHQAQIRHQPPYITQAHLCTLCQMQEHHGSA